MSEISSELSVLVLTNARSADDQDNARREASAGGESRTEIGTMMTFVNVPSALAVLSSRSENGAMVTLVGGPWALAVSHSGSEVG